MITKTLVGQVRQELLNARENGHDMLANFTDREIAQDIIECTGQYENIEVDLVAAIATVRKEGLDALE